MNELTQVFNYNTKEVRTVIINSEPWFVAKDVCDILNLDSTASRRLDEDEKGLHSMHTPGGNQEVIIVNEPGLYSLVMRSKKTESKQFKRWITHEVIPTIRKTGGYVNNDDLFINTYLPFADDTTKVMFRNTLQVVKTQNELIKKQQAEIEYKEDVIINLVDAITLADKRQVLNRVVKHKGANYQDRWR